MSVVVQRSDVAGDGLFAAEDLPVGFKLRYEGVYKKATDCTVAELDYAANVGCGVYIVGCGLASKINDAYGTSHTYNCTWEVEGSGVFADLYVVCCRVVRRGEELFIDYGAAYWERHLKKSDA
jgi:hypothetical protein